MRTRTDKGAHPRTASSLIRSALVIALSGAACWLAACSANESGDGDDDGRVPPGASGTGGTKAPSAGNGGSSGSGFDNAPGAGSGGSRPALAGTGGMAPGVCASATTGVELQPVHLALAFDVSGSMGKGDEPWHDKALKWDPVVAATRAFLEDDASSGLEASLTFFPADGDEDERCVVESYTTPDVPFTPLPSNAFGEAIAAIEPQSDDDWRGGTPTAWVMRGSRAFIESSRASKPGRYAIVLITDGYPQGCDDADDTIEAVVAEAEGAAQDGVQTYVIGVANPPIDDAPDTVTNLEDIAAAGGTSPAFLIDTGNPQDTSTRFEAAIDAIRGAAVACDLTIPPPPAGQTFDKEKVAVSYKSGAAPAKDIAYDADCAGDGFHYDDPQDPKAIVLCGPTCTTVQADPEASLEVALTCDRRFTVM
jgi:hypothetical protein